jgi:peptidyl-dipeptidase A
VEEYDHMKRYLLAAAAVSALAGCATNEAGTPVVVPVAEASPPPAAAPALTAADAKAFTDRAEAELATFSEYAARVSWVRNTYITYDTMELESQANAKGTEMSVRYAKEAARFDNVPGIDPVTRRKLLILKTGLVLPAPDKDGAADELAAIGTRMDSTYATGKFSYKGKTLNLDDASEIIAKSRDPNELRAVWEGWRTISPSMRNDYARMVEIANEGSRDLGFADTGALWRSSYDMSPDEFAAYTDKLWTQVEPFYKNLHCYVRGRLNAKYGDAVQPKTGPIRADLLGNMWAQEWGNIYDVVAPKGMAATGVDVEKLLVAKKYDPVKMVKTGENFYSSLGLRPLPQTFWERSMITRPRDREVVCHASAWDLDNREDVRIKMCTKVTADDFQTVHHELGHNYYQRAYMNQPFLFKNGANDGFHEAIGDFAALSAVTPTYLNQIGLLDKVPASQGEDIPFLLRLALDKIAFLPFGLMVDRWRWDVFNGQTAPAQYNARWWELVGKYQGLTPPGGSRPADAFDPGAKYHVPANVPYTRYFLARILQFQFHRAACQQAGWKGPLYRCSVYGQKEMGAKFNAMMEMGASRPWPEALEAFTGQRDIDATAVADYFAPLNAWLVQQNRGQACGW